MTTKPDPLTWQTPIVDGSGRPTLEFQRKWLQIQGVAAKVPELESIFVLTTSPLHGGGSLGDSPLTLTLNFTALLALFTKPEVSTLLDLIGSTQGDILYRDATGWKVLPPGTAGQKLTTGGAGANPSWT